MMIQLAVEFAIGDIVQFKIADPDGEKMKGIVIGYKVNMGELITYRLHHADGGTGDYYAMVLEKVEE